MTESKARRRGVLLGVLVTLPLLLVGAVPAARHLFDGHLPFGGAASSSSPNHHPRVARGTQVEISGTARRQLRPGGSSSLNLAFTNHSSNPVILRQVRVTITAISAPQANGQHPCTPADFRVRPMRATALVLPGGASVDLTRLAVPSWRWPHLEMRNRLTNQDGCKDARLTLTYVGYRAWSG